MANRDTVTKRLNSAVNQIHRWVFVLNINTLSQRSRSTQNVIHCARSCASLDIEKHKENGRQITDEHPKYCSNNYDELANEMEALGLPYKPCGQRNCLNGTIPTGSRADEARTG
ncbi:hypothetical protein PAECIP111802_07412 [Paenibacillus allorhizosphaerae]|uniref:Uncharacterized protein n=1 Tax=Paenibacillus allorhizosphaerae TaxID=2849866 RepID=A0ABM8VV00_9BACL|nr:hypothetical protein PAECIP111802_07412 [Paenibacillus allorhizosphaerae]